MIVIDGYNLLHSLKQGQLTDDNINESRTELIRMLAAFARLQGKKIRVYFDCKSLKFTGTKSITPSIEIYYVEDADKSIMRDIRNMAASSIVSSDNELIRVANSNKCSVATSEQFTAELREALRNGESVSSEKTRGISSEEAAYWMDYFGIDEDCPEPPSR